MESALRAFVYFLEGNGTDADRMGSLRTHGLHGSLHGAVREEVGWARGLGVDGILMLVFWCFSFISACEGLFWG